MSTAVGSLTMRVLPQHETNPLQNVYYRFEVDFGVPVKLSDLFDITYTPGTIYNHAYVLIQAYERDFASSPEVDEASRYDLGDAQHWWTNTFDNGKTTVYAFFIDGTDANAPDYNKMPNQKFKDATITFHDVTAGQDATWVQFWVSSWTTLGRNPDGTPIFVRNRIEANFQAVEKIPTSTPGDDAVSFQAVANGFDAGTGFDTLNIYGASANYTLATSGTGLWVTDKATGAQKAVTGFEVIRFSDKTMFALDAKGASMARLYTAALDRQPDQAGMKFYVEAAANGASLEQVATGFINSPEFKTAYGSSTTAVEYVNLLYRNVLGREGEPDGVAFHVARLEGGATREQVLLGFSESPECQQLASEYLMIYGV